MTPRGRKIVFIGCAIAAVALLLAVGGYLLLHMLVQQRVGQRLESLTPLVDQHSERTQLPSALLLAVIHAESSGNPQAISHADARGLMQIRPAAETDALRVLRLPDSARGDLFDPDYNLLIGSTYLAMLFDRFDADAPLALAAYHMGPTRISQLQREHPTLDSQDLIDQHAGPQTQAYVRKVLRLWREKEADHHAETNAKPQ